MPSSHDYNFTLPWNTFFLRFADQINNNFVNVKQKRKGNMCDTGGFLPQKLFKDSSPRKRLYFFFIRRLWLAACSFSSLISPYSSQLNSYSQHCSLNNVKGCAILIAHLLHLLGDTHATREAWLCYHEEVPSCV